MGNVPGAYGPGIGDRSRIVSSPSWGRARLTKEWSGEPRVLDLRRLRIEPGD